MIYWIRKFAAILGTSCFFVLFFIGLAHGGTYSLDSILFALAKAIFGASLPWVVGIVIADNPLEIRKRLCKDRSQGLAQPQQHG